MTARTSQQVYAHSSWSSLHCFEACETTISEAEKCLLCLVPHHAPYNYLASIANETVSMLSGGLTIGPMGHMPGGHRPAPWPRGSLSRFCYDNVSW